MLSQDILLLKVWFEALLAGEHELTASGAFTFLAALDEAAEQAADIEVRLLAAALQHNGEPEAEDEVSNNVVQFPPPQPSDIRPEGEPA